MSNEELFSPDDYPLAVPQVDNEPVEWTQEAILQLATLPTDELNRHIAKMLEWYVREDETHLGQEGNEPWTAGHYMAKALVTALAIKTTGSPLPTTAK